MPAKRITSSQKQARERFNREVGARLRVVREVMGFQQNEFGRKAGIASNTYHQIEKGTKRPSLENAIALCDAHGLTLDYIFRGDTGDLRHSVGQTIEALAHARNDTCS